MMESCHEADSVRVFRVKPFDRRTGEAVDAIPLQESDEDLIKLALRPGKLAASERAQLQTLLCSLRTEPGGQKGFEPKEWLLVTDSAEVMQGPEDSAEAAVRPESGGMKARNGQTTRFYTTRVRLDYLTLTLHEITRYRGLGIRIVVSTPPVRKAVSFHHEGRETSESFWERNPNTERHENTLGRYLLSAMKEADLHIFSDKTVFRGWSERLREKLRIYQLLSGKSFADACIPLDEFDPEEAAGRLRNSVWPRGEDPHILVLGIVDSVSGSEARIRFPCERPFRFRDGIARPGVPGTQGPFMLFGTATLSERNPRQAVLRRAFAQPVWTRERPCPVDSQNERHGLDGFTECAARLVDLGLRMERVVFGFRFSDHGIFVQPDYRLTCSGLTAFVEMLGLGYPDSPARSEDSLDPDYRARKQREKAEIVEHALYAEIDAVALKRDRRAIIARVDQIVDAFGRLALDNKERTAVHVGLLSLE